MLAKAVELSEKHGWFLSRRCGDLINERPFPDRSAGNLGDFDDGLNYFCDGLRHWRNVERCCSCAQEESPDTWCLPGLTMRHY